MDVVTCRYPLTRELLCRASDVRYRARGRWVRLACAAVGGLAGLYLALSAAGSFRTYFWQPPLATALLIGGLTAALWGNRLFLWRGLRGLRRPCRRGAEATLILSPQGLVWRAPGLQVEAEPGGWQVLETGELLVFLVGRRCIPLPKNALPAPSEEALTQLRQWSGGRWRRCPATPCPALWRRWEEGWSRRFPAGETPPWRAAQLRPYGRVFLWAALVLGGGQLCYYAAVVGERGCRYLWPWLAPLLNGLTLLAALGAALCLARRSGLGRALLAAFFGALLGVNAVCAAADALTTHRLIAPSPDFRQVVVLRRNTASGRMIFYRSVGGVFIRPETSLQGWLEGGRGQTPVAAGRRLRRQLPGGGPPAPRGRLPLWRAGGSPPPGAAGGPLAERFGQVSPHLREGDLSAPPGRRGRDLFHRQLQKDRPDGGGPL
ncbi:MULTISPECIES: hypothetical protein [Eubacteriales]|uniref:Uncharacterized protein n=1 Tax=Bittarella massiliensis (ex Durand et al. 2017) TaxID=1720313 RepID=A0AAQ1ME24_9FIRM|nr:MULTISPECIES: hypothetical protein [Eubacteriales]ERI95976.1 hypothetical protein HMPREF0262_03698 [Clostridium sp. ATCC 29733]MZL68249.1 hypothetical protein [Bittarella massiliensis (ex Durand et al. 2017)]MZL79696.1 hypothetical protein [Bittarella massiliensis (ex Durand et al. 2017)]SHG21827.1 hypothetical protein SAMN05444424_1921 [Bittarella massiliensis (ex Durand et al. 2017)]